MRAKLKTFYNLSNLQKRFVAIILSIIIIFAFLIGRVFYLQIVAGQTLQARAMEQWLRDLPLT